MFRRITDIVNGSYFQYGQAGFKWTTNGDDGNDDDGDDEEHDDDDYDHFITTTMVTRTTSESTRCVPVQSLFVFESLFLYQQHPKDHTREIP